MSKYKAKPTYVDGLRFASQKEARDYRDLLLLERAGEISNLELQPRYDFIVNNVLLCFYKADFRYTEKGKTIVHDSKGFKTPMYRLKKKMMKAFHGITIRET